MNKSDNCTLEDYESINKAGFINNGFSKSSNLLMRKISYVCGLDCYTVYMMLLSHRNALNNKCFPSIELIAKECNASTDTIKRKIKLLKDNGFLSVNSGKQGISNNYYFPCEDFYKKFKMDTDQIMARSVSKAFKKKPKDNEDKNIEIPDTDGNDIFDDDPFSDFCFEQIEEQKIPYEHNATQESSHIDNWQEELNDRTISELQYKDNPFED
jgi:DNA-binding transcriptional regulator YhcF (GntR family)